MRSLQLLPLELSRRQRILIAAGILVVAVLFMSRAALERTRPTGEAVPWADYPAELRSQIDGLAAAGACGALAVELDTARAGDRSTLQRTGHDNARLIAYIADQMQASGC